MFWPILLKVWLGLFLFVFIMFYGKKIINHLFYRDCYFTDNKQKHLNNILEDNTDNKTN